MKKRITIWLDEGKPLKVKTTKSEEFYLDDLGKLLEVLKEKGMEDASYVVKQSKDE